ncbi:hypothetical protein M1B72_20825 [Geomonas paludis]|uniref:Uncharacterized protein n=1 Tax=Geomonas paludis TaxID=2740185 RepID=A0A6V8MRG0_9BACT|nr:hypothetical protein [Geomonas paludis]UPU35854.1 hypothetical protein M1B72_20825 [Geomonas paludis]GFO62562.1 hypothetical protein GMPD_04810 [Geomonas paludis]
MVVLNWDVHRWQTEFELDNLKDYFHLMEAQFQAAMDAEKEKLQQWPPPNLNEEEFAIWESEVEFFRERYEFDFPSKIRYSYVVLLYITLEDRLRAVCDEIAKRRKLTITENNLKGSVIERTKLFLTRVASVPVQDTDAWQWLNDFQKVRDCIIHANGCTAQSRDKKRLIELARKDIGLSLLVENIVIDQKYYQTTMLMIQRCFQTIFESAGFGPSTIVPIIPDDAGDSSA